LLLLDVHVGEPAARALGLVEVATVGQGVGLDPCGVGGVVVPAAAEDSGEHQAVPNPSLSCSHSSAALCSSIRLITPAAALTRPVRAPTNRTGCRAARPAPNTTTRTRMAMAVPGMWAVPWEIRALMVRAVVDQLMETPKFLCF